MRDKGFETQRIGAVLELSDEPVPLRAVGEWPGVAPQAEPGFAPPGIASDHPAEDQLSRAQQRLDVAVGQIRRLGGTAQGEVVEEPDSLRAIESVLARLEFDEIILSTLPRHVSAWLHIDLPSRVARSSRARSPTWRPTTHRPLHRERRANVVGKAWLLCQC
jgi:hypothetical protein